MTLFEALCARYRNVYHGQNIHNPIPEDYPPKLHEVLSDINGEKEDKDEKKDKLRMFVTQVYVLGFELWMTGYTETLETIAVEVRPFYPSCFVYIPKDSNKNDDDHDDEGEEGERGEERVYGEITRILTDEKERRWRERGEQGKKPKPLQPLSVEKQAWNICPHATNDGNQKQVAFKITLPAWYLCGWLKRLAPSHWRILNVDGISLDLSFIIDRRIDLCQWCELDMDHLRMPSEGERKTTAVMKEYVCPAINISPAKHQTPPPPLLFQGFDIETSAERAVQLFLKSPDAQEYTKRIKDNFHAVRYDQLDSHIPIPSTAPPDDLPSLQVNGKENGKIGKRPIFVIPKATRLGDCIINIVSQFWFYGGGVEGNGRVFLRVSHMLKSAEPPPNREFEARHKLTFSFDDEAELIRSWVTLFRETFDIEWLTGHNINKYDVPYIFQRAITLGIEEEIAQKLSRHHDHPASIQEVKQGNKTGLRVDIPGVIQFDTLNVIKDKGDVRLSSYALSACLKLLDKKNKKPKKKRELPYYLLTPFHVLDGCTRWELDCYNDADVNAVRELVQQLYLPNSLLSMAAITSTNVNDILLRGLSLRCYRQQIRKMYDEGFLLDHVQRHLYQTRHMKSMSILAQTVKLQMKTEAREKSRVKRNEDSLLGTRPITDFFGKKQHTTTTTPATTTATTITTTTATTTPVTHKKRTWRQMKFKDSNEDEDDDRAAEDKARGKGGGRKREKAYKGARVIPVKKGTYNQPVATLDFSSLYPTIMIGYKLCYNTFIPHEMSVDWDRIPRSLYGKYANDPTVMRFPTLQQSDKQIKLWFLNEVDLDHLNVTPPLHDPDRELLILVVGVGRERTCWVQSWPAIIAKSLSECLTQRKRAKQEMEAAMAKKDETLAAVKNGDQLAVKRQANSQYGFFGTIGGPSDFIMESQAICQIGRILNHFMERVAMKPPFNHPSIYGDTDSIMPVFPAHYSMDQIQQECKTIARIVTEACPRPIELTYEKLMGRSTFYANKNYAYWLVWPLKPGENPLCTRGLPDTRRNYCRLVRDLSTKVLTLLHDPNLQPTTAHHPVIQAAEHILNAFDQHVYETTLPYAVQAALYAVQEALSILVEKKAKVEDVEITVQLAGSYEGKAEVVQKELIRKMQSREIDVDVGSRIAYVILDIPGAKLFEQAETTDHFRDHPELELNWAHYIKHMEAPMRKLFKYHLNTTAKRALLTHLFDRSKRLSKTKGKKTTKLED